MDRRADRKRIIRKAHLSLVELKTSMPDIDKTMSKSERVQARRYEEGHFNEKRI